MLSDGGFGAGPADRKEICSQKTLGLELGIGPCGS